MLSDVLKSLKNTSKGSLQYDRSWVFECRAKDILSEVSGLTRIHSLPNEEEPLGQPESKENVEIKSVQLSDESPVRPRPAEEQQVLHDNCQKIIEYEGERKKRVQESVLSFVSELDNFDDQHSRHVEQQMALHQRGWKIAVQKRTDQIARLQLEELLEVKEQQKKLKEHQKTHAHRLNEKIREMGERQRQLEELELRRKQAQMEMRQQLLAIQSQLKAVSSSYAELLNSCSRPDLLERKPEDYVRSVLEAQEALRQMLDTQEELSPENARQAQDHFLAAKAGMLALQTDLAQSSSRLKEMEQTAENEQRQALKISSPTASPGKNNDMTMKKEENLQQTNLLDSNSSLEKEELVKDLGVLSGCVEAETYTLYLSLMKAAQEWEDISRPLQDDPKLKKVQFEMKKVVNTPVNAISSQSGRQLRDKLDRLSRLLTGATVPSAGGKGTFSAQTHPLGLHFCAHLLAKKIVSQAESQVSAHQEAAFPLAAVTVGLWCRFPKFGELLLAQLYLRCPYLLPIYHQQIKGQDEKDYHILLGYKYENGEMEPQDQFLKRMSGIVCFYAALMQTSAPPGYANCPHPHGIQHGWQFLTRLVNLRPRFDVTATVLFHLLEVAGSALFQAYGRQMYKLVNCLHSEYLAQIRKVTAGESGGPVSRLEIFLANTAKSGRIAAPAGTITTGFWNT